MVRGDVVATVPNPHVTLLSSVVYVLVNLGVDLCYLLLDPRIRY
jgi:ABC-type dipeptide/oligopeptide/nickel transport system permease component